MLQGLHQDDWILRPKMHPALDALVERELGFDALILPRHLPHIATLARRYPELRIVIDHAAKPAFRHDDLADWSADIGRFADLPNTCCKLSGLLTEARPEQRADPEVFQPCVARLLEVFGPQRLMWGSDWPVLELAGDYGGWLGLARELLERAGLSATDMHSVFDTNARDFYRITSTPLP
jgi:L-fuconolactonase